MPSPSRRGGGPPPSRASRSSPSFRRRSSPDRRRPSPDRRRSSPDRNRRAVPQPRHSGTSKAVSPPRQRERRRTPDLAVHAPPPRQAVHVPPRHAPPDSRSRPSSSRRAASHHSRSPVSLPPNPNGRSFSAVGKRKASPKRGHEVVERSSRTIVPPKKMMRSSSPEGPKIPLLDLPFVPTWKSYRATSPVPAPPSPPSEEWRRIEQRTSAQKKATSHMTSSRFGSLRDQEDTALIPQEPLGLDYRSTALKGYVFNVANVAEEKSLHSQRIVRDIVRPEALRIVRRPASNGREARTTVASYNHNNSLDWEDEEIYRNPGPAWADSREGACGIFDRFDSARPNRGEDSHGQESARSRSPQVIRYVSPEPSREPPRNGRSHSRAAEVPSSSRETYYEVKDKIEYLSRAYEREREEHRGSRRGEDRNDLRHDLDHRRDTSRHSQERGRHVDHRGDSDSDLRERINEKRTTTRSAERSYPPRERERERGERDRGEREHERERRHSPRRPSASTHDRSVARSSHRREKSTERYREEEREDYRAPNPWEVDPEFVPRGRAYFEHDNRGEHQMMMRGRGYPPPRGFVHHGPGMVHPMRGAPFGRGGFIPGRGVPRGRGFPPPRGFIPIGARRPYAGLPMRRPYNTTRRPYAIAPPRRPVALTPTPSVTATPTKPTQPAPPKP